MKDEKLHHNLKAWVGGLALLLILLVVVVISVSTPEKTSITEIENPISKGGESTPVDSETFTKPESSTSVVDQITPDIRPDPVIYDHVFDLPVMPPAIPAWQKWAVKVDTSIIKGSDPIIAIVIDDLGPSRINSFRIMDMDPPLTLAFLPYAQGVQNMAKKAADQGHEIILHLPMEPMDLSNNPGPDYLRAGQDPLPNLIKNLAAFDGYIGINNHMGSRFTADHQAMAAVLSELKNRQLLFLDSRTSAQSAVPDWIKQHPDQVILERDVFLDHHRSTDKITDSLNKLERIARKHGHAIGIGHPYPETIKAIKNWRAGMDKDIHLVPLSAIYQRRQMINQ
jgi:hypothetical protein